MFYLAAGDTYWFRVVQTCVGILFPSCKNITDSMLQLFLLLLNNKKIPNVAFSKLLIKFSVENCK